MKPILLKRNVKLKNLRYEIDGVDSWWPAIHVASAVVIGFLMALSVMVLGLGLLIWTK